MQSNSRTVEHSVRFLVYTIAQQLSFSASHRLDGLAPHHPEARDHGHNYVVEVRLASGKLDDAGRVTDSRYLAALNRYIEERLDRRCLNDVLPGPPSCELLAQHLYEWCKTNWKPGLAVLLHQVRVYDNPSSWAAYDRAADSDHFKPMS